ncbi:response regulator [Mesobacterium hydrothermale]|nr:response regulator [Mesobacterium sp. TK19101]
MKSMRALKLFVVDDMATSRGLITQALDEIGLANYETEADPRVALQAILRNPVHLVLSDFNMPGMSGLQLLEQLRRTPATKNIGFILITGRPSPEIVAEAQRLKLNNLIKKPFTADAMRKCIEAVTGPLAA